MVKIRDTMNEIHPLVAFAFFAFVLVMSMLFLHPVYIIISLTTGTVWAFLLRGKQTLRFLLTFVLPITILVAILNPLFNHKGVTILFYIRDNPITLESMIYAVTSAFMFASVLIWFSCFNEVMKSDKIIYLFGKTIPSVSLIITMVLRFVPLYKQQAKRISIAMRAQGIDVSQGSIIKRAKCGLSILSALITWGLESSVTAADSMRSRGHGLPHRTHYSVYRFDRRDLILSILLIIGIAFIGVSAGTNTIYAKFYPVFKLNSWNAASIICTAVYALILLIPIILNLTEAVSWRHLKSKI